MPRNVSGPTLTGVLLVFGTAGVALGFGNQRDNKTFAYTVGLWGDLPYSDVQAEQGLPRLIEDMNDSDIEFSVHDGDLRAGSGVPGSVTQAGCTDAVYLQVLRDLDTLDKPAMFTPGDNDWVDCDRPSNGGFNSLERSTTSGKCSSIHPSPWAATSSSRRSSRRRCAWVLTAPRRALKTAAGPFMM